jgi:hypothetical protein
VNAEIRALVARQRAQRVEESATRLKALLAPSAESDWLAFRRRYAAGLHARQQLHTEPTPEEAS